jgi:hypothetical protein
MPSKYTRYFLPGCFFRSQCRFSVLLVECLLLIGLGQQSCWAKGNDVQPEQVTVTLKAVFTAKGHFSHEGPPTADDDITITLNETSTFRVHYEWYEQKVAQVESNELLSSRHKITVAGKGKLILGDDLPTPTWTYGPDDRQSNNYCSVSFKKDGIHGGLTLLNFTNTVKMICALPEDGLTAPYPMAPRR